MTIAIGVNCSFNYTSGPETLVEENFDECLYVETRAAHETTRPGSKMAGRTAGILDAYGLLGGWHDTADATPPTPGGSGLPTGTVGTATFTFASGDTKTLKIMLVKLQVQTSNSNGSPPQRWQYAWVACSTVAGTDTIVTA